MPAKSCLLMMEVRILHGILFPDCLRKINILLGYPKAETVDIKMQF